jgi:hypothetical protein
VTPFELLAWTIAGSVLIVALARILIGLSAQLSSSGTLTMRTDIIELDKALDALKKSYAQDLVLIRRAIEHEEDLRREVTRRVERLETGLADLRLRVDEHIERG